MDLAAAKAVRVAPTILRAQDNRGLKPNPMASNITTLIYLAVKILARTQHEIRHLLTTRGGSHRPPRQASEKEVAPCWLQAIRSDERGRRRVPGTPHSLGVTSSTPVHDELALEERLGVSSVLGFDLPGASLSLSFRKRCGAQPHRGAEQAGRVGDCGAH